MGSGPTRMGLTIGAGHATRPVGAAVAGRLGGANGAVGAAVAGCKVAARAGIVDCVDVVGAVIEVVVVGGVVVGAGATGVACAPIEVGPPRAAGVAPRGGRAREAMPGGVEGLAPFSSSSSKPGGRSGLGARRVGPSPGLPRRFEAVALAAAASFVVGRLVEAQAVVDPPTRSAAALASSRATFPARARPRAGPASRCPTGTGAGAGGATRQERPAGRGRSTGLRPPGGAFPVGGVIAAPGRFFSASISPTLGPRGVSLSRAGGGATRPVSTPLEPAPGRTASGGSFIGPARRRASAAIIGGGRGPTGA